MGNKKPGALSYTGLLVVAGVDEISNFELLRNLKKIVDFITMYVTYLTVIYFWLTSINLL